MGGREDDGLNELFSSGPHRSPLYLTAAKRSASPSCLLQYGFSSSLPSHYCAWCNFWSNSVRSIFGLTYHRISGHSPTCSCERYKSVGKAFRSGSRKCFQPTSDRG